MTATIETPELDKMLAVKERSQAIGEFIDGGPYYLAEYITHEDDDRERLEVVTKPIEQILADWFGIDLAKCEDERRLILTSLNGASK